MAKLAILAAAAVAAVARAHWAVVMAGSNSYGNYRHQADSFHAYQILKKHGIPENQIILLAYDDIANNTENPFPGKVFNKPNGTDVYAGVKISYKGAEVTAANFLKVLKGDTSAPGPVLKSTAEDKVFVYYTDHGGPGILGVPMGAGDFIHAADVNDALVTMHQKGMYKELLFYVEACESGSIFQGLLKAPNVKAVTASNAVESSWGTYCPPNDKVQGKEVMSCLGDEFSVNWMEDADVADFAKETVATQIASVTTATKKSHVTQFGDKTIDPEVIGEFEGGKAVEGELAQTKVTSAVGEVSKMPQRDVEMLLEYWKFKRATSVSSARAHKKNLSEMYRVRNRADRTFTKVAMVAAEDDKEKASQFLADALPHITQVECHKKALAKMVSQCGGMNEFLPMYSGLMIKMCESSMPMDDILLAIGKGCEAPATCIGSNSMLADTCWKGTAGSGPLSETMNIKVTSFSDNAGTMDVTSSGLASLDCKGVSFTQSSESITVNWGSCLPSGVKVDSVKFCSNAPQVLEVELENEIHIPVSLSSAPCDAEELEIIV